MHARCRITRFQSASLFYLQPDTLHTHALHAYLAQEKEEGEITPPATPTAEQADLQRRREEKAAADRDRAARRRMLGNIQFIGYLFKFGLLTER